MKSCYRYLTKRDKERDLGSKDYLVLNSFNEC